MPSRTDITLDEALATQKALRAAAGLPEERFGVPEVIGMLSDEIEALRDSGRDDAEIARLIADASGLELDGEDVSRHFEDRDDED
jgi:hypothetical protein